MPPRQWIAEVHRTGAACEAVYRKWILGSEPFQPDGMNVQVLADPAGRLIWASDALPGAAHDLTAARNHGIPAPST